MWSKTFLCLCSVVFVISEDVRESKVVDTAQGPVRGYRDPETGIFSYQSIPYATAPTGTNRFKAPLPPPVWMQPLEAIDRGIICPQTQSLFKGNYTMQENCLIVNVHVPDIKEYNLPVLVIVHGGGFQIGYGDMLVPKTLMVEHNIISVTLNYRLGAHGFLCLSTEDVPGNGGMKDIVAALRWVRKNIANFGGDPDDVTISGYSAGAAAVDLIMLSKSAEGLFNKVIPESGPNIGAWTIQSNPLDTAQSYAKRLNFGNVENIFALEDFYKTVPHDLLITANDFERKDTTFGFSPCVERFLGEDVFMDKNPVEILKSGQYRKLPLLYGFANMEGLMRIGLFETWKNKMNENFADFLPADLEFISNEEKESAAKRIKEFYFGDEPIGNHNIISYVDFFTDIMFAYPALRSVKYHVEAGHDKIYLYEYSFVDDNTPLVPHTNVKGADHGTQIIPIYNEIPGMKDASNFTEEFKRISVVLREMWGNFIKTGAPVSQGGPSWTPVGPNRSPHMSLSNEISLGGPLLERRTRFWDDIYERHYRDPVPPPLQPTLHQEL